VYGYLGEKDQAFELLERAYADRSAGLTWMKIDHDLDPLRSDRVFFDCSNG
jgi:hypothetical protein